ncbi:MAG: Asp-tRNA(Asn)/Glu-tRNA(Gln) amidotransferase subunit GatA [Anaerolineae bacterium]|nr:Asp-tRNA(Asn)/Glu-tRNA(Gln) amidotransferase subunit GatA [Anaerolineae bacterium]
MADLTELTLLQAAQGLRSKDFSSREITQAYLERIERLDGKVKAYLTVTAELALSQAKAADDRLAKGGTDLPPLLGVPLAVKDVLAVDGVRTTCGSKILENFVPPYTGTAVQRLLDAGMVVLGKTNTDEFAMGSSTENSAYFTTANPWDLSRVPGGSSGGSAASVAGRLAPAALGTDTGGSVRQPAAFCGVTGLKPTYGRVSRYGLIAYGSSLDSVGVLGRSAADAAALYTIMAGVDPLDSTSMDIPVPEIKFTGEDEIKGLKVGVPAEYFIEGIQPAVEEKVRAAIAQFEELGAEIIEVSLPHTKYALPVYYLIAPAEASANLARFDGVRYGLRVESEDMIDMFMETRGAGFGEEVKRRIMLGTYALSAGYYDAYYGQAQKVRTLIQQDFLKVFEQVDVIAAPVAPTTAFKPGEHRDDPLAMYLEDVFTLPANLAGVPGLAFPTGFDGDGLPVGMQLMGKHFGEETLLKAVHVYQQATEWGKDLPEV